jgi:hypothetical protein
MPIYEILSDGTATLYGKPCKRPGSTVWWKKQNEKYVVFWQWDSGDGEIEYMETVPVITVNYRVEANKIASAINDAEKEWGIEQKRKAKQEADRKLKEAEEAKKKVSIKGSIAPTNPWGKK